MGENVKIGLIGAGEIGVVHAEAWAQLGDVVFCVAGGRNPDQGRALEVCLAAQTSCEEGRPVDL